MILQRIEGERSLRKTKNQKLKTALNAGWALRTVNKKGRVLRTLPFLITAAIWVLFAEPAAPASQTQEGGAEPPTPPAAGACRNSRV
jgi:hypothetical protein